MREVRDMTPDEARDVLAMHPPQAPDERMIASVADLFARRRAGDPEAFPPAVQTDHAGQLVGGWSVLHAIVRGGRVERVSMERLSMHGLAGHEAGQ